MPQKAKPYWLLVMSYGFYSLFGIKNLLILLATTIVVYIGACFIEKYQGDKKKKNIILILELIFSIGLLVVFKYSNFIIENVNTIAEKLHMSYQFNEVSLILPAGISFYVFSVISYTIDVYRGTYAAEKNFFKFALYISYFPKVTSGPIERFGDFKEQLERKITFDYENVKDGFLLAALGFAQKLIVADRLGVMVSTVFGNYNQYSGFTVFLASIMYTLQIYWDFTGYTNIALGASQMLGIKMKDNFRQPYLAVTIRDFWKRWHISLTSWFGSYLYIPLGGNRKGKLRKYINIMIVFGVSGLWHGASWNFIIWGLLHGVYQVMEDVIAPAINGINKKLSVRTDTFSYRFGQRTVTFLLVNFAWIFFGANGTRNALGIIKQMFAEFNPWIFFDGSLYKLGISQKQFSLTLFVIGILIFIDICREKISMRDWIRKQNLWFRWLLYLMLLFGVIIFGYYNNGYDASSFIYNNF